MIGKVIAHGATRDEALDRLSAALGRTVVAGPKTNVAFLKALCDAEGFRNGAFDTGFIDRNLEELIGASSGRDANAVRLGARALIDRARASLTTPMDRLSAWGVSDGFQLGQARRQAMPIVVDGERMDVDVTWPGPDIRVDGGGDTSASDGAIVVSAGDAFIVVNDGRQMTVTDFDPFDVDLEHFGEGGVVKAPIHGRLVDVFVKVGDRVEKGQRLAIVEAMKMEHSLLAPQSGAIVEVSAEAGAQVAEGARLILLAAEEKTDV